MARRSTPVVVAVALSLAVASPALAQGAEVTTVLEGGLNSPRGMAFGSDGVLYVAQAGTGGTDSCALHAELAPEGDGICYANTGSISTIVDGVVTDIIEGLPSGITPTGEVLGPSDVAVDEMGTVWFTVGSAGSGEFRDSIPDGLGENQGFLFKADGEGGYEKVADLVAFEVENDPDKDLPGNEHPDSNANSVLVSDHGIAVADAGGNSMILVGDDGSMSVGAVFPFLMAPFAPPEGEATEIPADAVPTSVVMGPDNVYYVGQLTGFPFPAGLASVYRVAPGAEPEVYATGFTNVVDIGFASDGTLYVLEIAHNGLLAPPPEGSPPLGGLWRVPPGGGEPELLSDSLIFPGGLAIDASDNVHIATCTSCPPGAGGIVSFQH